VPDQDVSGLTKMYAVSNSALHVQNGSSSVGLISQFAVLTCTGCRELASSGCSARVVTHLPLCEALTSTHGGMETMCHLAGGRAKVMPFNGVDKAKES
jgi:hypothetical protein